MFLKNEMELRAEPEKTGEDENSVSGSGNALALILITTKCCSADRNHQYLLHKAHLVQESELLTPIGYCLVCAIIHRPSMQRRREWKRTVKRSWAFWMGTLLHLGLLCNEMQLLHMMTSSAVPVPD